MNHWRPALPLLWLGMIFCGSISEAANLTSSSIPKFLSGKLAAALPPIVMQPIDQRGHQRIQVGKQILTSKKAYLLPPAILAADLNFDGWADLWLTGCENGQCRDRGSDVWLYQPATKGFAYSIPLSQLGNLLIDPTNKVLQSGMDNAGCAGLDFYYTVYQWKNRQLLPRAYREQSCEEAGIVYREFTIVKGKKQLQKESTTGEDDQTQVQRRNGGYHFLDF